MGKFKEEKPEPETPKRITPTQYFGNTYGTHGKKQINPVREEK